MTLSPETIARVRSALEQVRAVVHSGAKHYAEIEGLQGSVFPSSVQIKLDMIDYYAKGALLQIERDLSRGDLQGAIESATKEMKGE